MSPARDARILTIRCGVPQARLAGTAMSIIFGRGRLQIVHQIHVLRLGLARQARIELLLLADRGHCPALVVMAGVHQGLVGEPEQLVDDRVPGLAGVTGLEVRPAGAAIEQNVAGEHPVGQEES